MQVDLSGLRALVTGSTKGIGRAIARELAANGAEVVINGRKAADTEQAIVSLRAALPKARFKAAPRVTVNAVLPGPTLTEGVDAMFKSMGKSADYPKAQRDFIDSGRPGSIIKRLAKPEEVAAVVVFLCSREASAVTGSPVRADR